MRMPWLLVGTLMGGFLALLFTPIILTHRTTQRDVTAQALIGFGCLFGGLAIGLPVDFLRPPRR